MGEVITAYFDLDGTLLNASSEKTLTAHLAKKRPWRIPLGTMMWSLGFIGNMLRGRSLYDAARNRGHFCLASWDVLETMSVELATNKLAKYVPSEARECIEWHKEQGHRLVLISATVAPMAEAMAKVLGIDVVYGCGPSERKGRLSGSERGWSVPRRKGKVPIMQRDAELSNSTLSICYGYGNTMADSWFMRECGHPIAVNPESSLRKHAREQGWKIVDWKLDS
ncbi:MAG: HAD-IB family phosphatase [Candidatus Poseidoniales archaeon]